MSSSAGGSGGSSRSASSAQLSRSPHCMSSMKSTSGLSVRQPGQQLAQRAERAAAQLLRVGNLDVTMAAAGDRLDLAEHREEARERHDVARQDGVGFAGAELLEVLRDRIDDRVERLVGHRLALVAAADERDRMRVALAHVAKEAAHERGLAHARIGRGRRRPRLARRAMPETPRRARPGAVRARRASDRGATRATAPAAGWASRPRLPRRASTSRPPGRRAASGCSRSWQSASRSRGTPRARSLGRGGNGSSLALSTSRYEPRNGVCPVMASNNMTPTMYQSLASDVPSPDACSGDMYAGVPWTVTDCVSSGRDSCARPKSRMTTRPSCVTSTFDGLRSRCSMPALVQRVHAFGEL